MSPAAAQNILSLPSRQGSDAEIPLQRSWRHRLTTFFANALPANWQRVVVNEKTDSITMPKWVASAILIAVLGFGVQSWWARSADHDAMVRIETKLEVAKEQKEKDDARIENAQRDFRSWQGIMEGNFKTIIGMLSQQQVDTLKKVQKTTSQD